MGKSFNLKLIVVVCFYYVIIVVLSFITKFFVSENGYNFRFPLFKTGITNFCHFLGALIYLIWKNRNFKFSRLKETIACSFIGSIDTGCSFYVLRKVDLAFYTIMKSTTPVFILISGFLIGTEEVSRFSFISVLAIAFGTYLVTIRPNATNNSDLYLLIGSSIVSGFRWSLMQYIVTKKNRNIFVTIRDLCLPTSIFLFIFSFQFESIYEIVTSEFFATLTAATWNIFFLFALGFCSFIALVCELWIVKETSVLFLSVSSVIKEMMIIGISIFRGATCLSKLNYTGIAVSIVGILMYNSIRYKKI
ncbi:triose phosphate transporter [Nucleospora cyclopteri]